MHVEHARKHGPFDSRYPPIRHEPTPASLWRLGEERLDWHGFRGRFFPDSRRHDFDALVAYESYLNDGRPADGFTASAPASSPAAVHDRSDKTQPSEDWEELSATAGTERWEGDGGASTGSPPRSRRGQRPIGAHAP